MIKLNVLNFYFFLLSVGIFLNVILENELISFIIISMVFLSLVIFDFNDNLKIVFFLLPSFYYFSIIGISDNPITYFLVFSFIKYLFNEKGKRYDGLNLVLLFLVFTLIIVSALISDFYNLTELVRWSILFSFTVLLMSEKRTSRKFSAFSAYFIVGFFVSSIAGFAAFKTGGNLYDLTRAEVNENIINRFSGLSGDPNNYGMYALLVLTFLLMRFEGIKETKKSLFIWFCIVSVALFSVLTVSRALVVGFFFIITLFTILNLQSKRNVKVSFALIFFCVIGLMLGYYYGFLDGYLKRFDYSDMSDLTGSRNVIFLEYMEGFTNNSLWHYLFGSGVTSHTSYYFYNVDGFNSIHYAPFGTHNTFLELIVSFGLLGSIPFLILLYRCVFKNQSGTPNSLRYFDYLPILVIVIYFFSLQNLAKYSFYFILVLVSLYINSRKELYNKK